MKDALCPFRELVDESDFDSLYCAMHNGSLSKHLAKAARNILALGAGIAQISALSSDP
jgi:hypothetical protein